MEQRALEQSVIRTRRIELVDQRGDTSCVLAGGGSEGGQEGRVGIILYGPDGPVSAATISMDRENGRPAILLYTMGGGSILIGFDSDGGPVVALEDEDGVRRTLVT